jgi:LmbE family N-acetylglucosaminyl deacetylase
MQFPGRHLVVFAHPDDETAYFGGLLLAELGERADLICVTDGNFEGRGAERQSQLHRACEMMKVRSVRCLEYADHPLLHLPVDEIGRELRRRVKEQGYSAVFTHSPHGEYGHFNHMDVSLAAHEAAADLVPVYSIADMLFPDSRVALTREVYEKKIEILASIYFQELRSAWRTLRPQASEGYVRLDLEEVRAIHGLCTSGQRPRDEVVPHYRPFLRFLDQPWK